MFEQVVVLIEQANRWVLVGVVVLIKHLYSFDMWTIDPQEVGLVDWNEGLINEKLECQLLFLWNGLSPLLLEEKPLHFIKQFNETLEVASFGWQDFIEKHLEGLFVEEAVEEMEILTKLCHFSKGH